MNQEVNKRLGGHHSAEILLRSIDYNEIMSAYGKDHAQTKKALKYRLLQIQDLRPECLILCCNSLHKYLDELYSEGLNIDVPVMHALKLVGQNAVKQSIRKVLLLASLFTMEDGFFTDTIVRFGVEVLIPTKSERDQIHNAHLELLQSNITVDIKNFFSKLITSYQNQVDAIVLGCTEFAIAVNADNILLPVIDPVELQSQAAVDFALKDRT